jgi:outer membrane receptor for ferrienterochelin and colicin
VSARRVAVPGLLVAAWLAAAGRAHADDTDTSELEGLLEENVVSTASKSPEVGTTAPATVTTVTAEDLRRYGIRTVAEAIDFLALGAVTSDAQHAVEIGARGVAITNDNNDHMLLLVNGHTQNEPLYGRAQVGRGLAIPMEMIDHIEVILGPGSVLYGSNAMLGVINVVTKRAKDWNGAHVLTEIEPEKTWRVLAGAGATFQTPFSKTPAELTLGVEYFHQNGPGLAYAYRYDGIDGVTGRPERLRRDGPEDGLWGGVAKRAYYTKLPSAFVRLALGDFELNVAGSSFDRAAPYRNRYAKPYMDFDDPDSHERDRRLWIDLTHRAMLSPIARLTTRGYVDGWDLANQINTSQKGACLGAGDSRVDTCTLFGTGRSRWLGVETRGELDWFQNGHFVSTVGVDARLREIKQVVDFLDFATGRHLKSSEGIVDRNDTLLGAYVQQVWIPTRGISVNAGARLDKETRFEAVVSPRLAVAVAPWQGGTLKGSYAEAFRSPSFIETDYVTITQLPARGLVPETVRSVEGSFEQKLGAHRLMFGVFRSWWTNMVANHVLTREEQSEAVARGESKLETFGTSQFRNVAEIENWGVNATYEGTLGSRRQFHYGTNATAAIARRDEQGQSQPLTVTPSLFGNARVAYDLPSGWPTLALAGHYLGKRPVDRAFDSGWLTGTYAPQQLELRATISGAVPKLTGLSYRVTGSYGFAPFGPYVVGVAQDYRGPAYGPETYPPLLPLDQQFRTGIALQYDLLP